MNDNAYDTAPPPCPWWCTELHDNDGWVSAGGGLSKTCRRHVLGAEDIDGHPAGLELDRFASIVDGRVILDPPTVLLMALGPLSLDSVQSLAAAMTRLAEMTAEPRTAAA